VRLPVARVVLDVPLPHLDRPFDYLVPAAMAEAAQPGVRVRVRFAGRLVGGFVTERLAISEHPGRLSALSRVVSAEPVLSPEVLQLAAAVAARYAGTLSDVLRLAVPPRHARVEAQPPPAGPTGASTLQANPARPDPGPWERYAGGAGLVAALAEGRSPRAVWTALPGPGWPEALAVAVTATLASGRGALVVLPDGRDVARVDAVLADRVGTGQHIVLTADLGPAERYRRWLAVRRGSVRAVIGTRAAMFAPVESLGLVAVWDDGDDLHAEPHAPYPHVREVLGLRALGTGCGLLVGGFARTAEAAQLVGSGWARPVGPDRTALRRVAPRVVVAGDDSEQAVDPAARTARLPSVAWRTAHEAVTRGPVLVQVPRGGYLPSLACADCRTPARCGVCLGPLASAGNHWPPACAWCGHPAVDWQCTHCGGTRTRALVVGARRTAEELGRAFPRVPVRTSGRDGVLASVGPEPALVIATPGAEPVADGGYAAALLLDGWALLTRPDLRAAEEALRRWLAAAALVRPAGEGGQVVVLADPSSRAVQALVRWDPEGFADRELADRLASRLPPAARMASLTGARPALTSLLEIAELPPGAEVLGPVAADGPTAADAPLERMIVRVPRAGGRALAEALHAAAGVRSARKEPGSVRVQVDPLHIA
jgi:primosomal protein N' (replication factor Y)